MKNHQIRGLTLIELMVVVAIVGILGAVAYPSFQSSIRKSRRAEAASALQAIQLGQEKFRTRNTTYADSAALLSDNAFTGMCKAVGTECRSQNERYRISVSGNTESAFTLQATARGDQAQDTGCASIEVRHTATGSVYWPDACWSK